MSRRQEVVKPAFGTKDRRFLLLDDIFDDQGGGEERFNRCREVRHLSPHSREFLLLRRSQDKAGCWRRDLKTICQLRHPNILGYCDAWQSPDDVSHLLLDTARMFLSVCLRDMGQARPGAQLYPRWLFHISSALEYLHDQNNEDQPMLHRAVQPDNILITDRCVLKLCAFHTAKRLAARHDTTRTVYGGGLFQSPEITAKKPYDQSVDIWGFGVTAVYMANYIRAGKAGSAGKLRTILRESGQDPVTVSVVEEALQEDPAHRPRASQIVRRLTDSYGEPWLNAPPSLDLFPAALVKEQRRAQALPATPASPTERETGPPPEVASTIPPSHTPAPAQESAGWPPVSVATADSVTQTSFYGPEVKDRQTTSTQTSQPASSQSSPAPSSASTLSGLSDRTLPHTPADSPATLDTYDDLRILLEKVNTKYADISTSDCTSPADSPHPRGPRPGVSPLQPPQPAPRRGVGKPTPNGQKLLTRSAPSNAININSLMNYDGDLPSVLVKYKTEKVTTHSKSNINFGRLEKDTSSAEKERNTHVSQRPTKPTDRTRDLQKHHHDQDQSDDADTMVEPDHHSSETHAKTFSQEGVYRGDDRGTKHSTPNTVSTSNTPHSKHETFTKDSRSDLADPGVKRKTKRRTRSDSSNSLVHLERDKSDNRNTPARPQRPDTDDEADDRTEQSRSRCPTDRTPNPGRTESGLDPEALQKISRSIQDSKKRPVQPKQKRSTSRSAEKFDDPETGQCDRGEGDRGQQGRGLWGRVQEVRGYRSRDPLERDSSRLTHSAERPETQHRRASIPFPSRDGPQHSRERRPSGHDPPHPHHRHHVLGARASHAAVRSHDHNPHVETDGTSGLGDSCHSQEELLDY